MRTEVGLLISSAVLLLLHIHCCKKENPTHTYVRRGRFGGVQQEGEIHGSLLILLLLWLVLFPMLAQSLLLVWSYWHEPSSFSPYDDSWFGHIDTNHEFFSMLPNFCSWLGHIDTSQVAFILHEFDILLLAWSYWHMSSSILTSLISYSWHGHIDTCKEVFSQIWHFVRAMVMLIHVKKYKLHENCLWFGHIDTNQGIYSLM